ncbi:unnamed protein product [Effrenium voratum]|nr:unnamed protein product [Effrenium voratum]
MGSAEVTNEFAFRPYLVEPETIGGVKFFFQPSRSGYAWSGLIAESSWNWRLLANNSNGNHADIQSIEIYDIMFFVDMVGAQDTCYKQAEPIVAGTGYTWDLSNCGLAPGIRYRLFVYIIGEEYWDPVVDPDAVYRWPFWTTWHRDNGRVSNGVLVVPPFSNEWAWPDGYPYISKGPHGMGMDVTFTTVNPQGLLWAVIQDVDNMNYTIYAMKTAERAWGPAACRQMRTAVNLAATYTMTLTGCSLLPTPKLYVLILYTEDQTGMDDGKLSDPIYFQVPVSNGFIIQPSLVGEPGLDTGLSISFEAIAPGRVWLYVATKAAADSTVIVIPNVKDGVNAFDRTNCMVEGMYVPAALQIITMPNCPLLYLSSYVAYIYIEDENSHFDGTLSTPFAIEVGVSNGFEVEPALLSQPTTDSIDFRFTPKKPGRVWVVVTPSASLVEPPTRSRMVANFGAVGALSCRITAGLIEATVQTYSLTGCQLDPGQIYALYVYVEDRRFHTDGTLSRTVFVKVIRSNNFAVSPVLLTLPTLDGFDVRFQTTDPGRVWAMAVDAIGGSGVTSLSIRSLEGALGGPDCYLQDVSIDASLQIWNFTDCRFQDSKTYMIFIYVEAWPSVEGDGMLSGPMIASFFDASNVSLEDAGTGDVSPVLIVEDIPIVSNWFREDPRQAGQAGPNGATIVLRAALAEGRLFMLLTRYRPQVSGETVYNGWNAVGGLGCQKLDMPITDQVTTVQLSECGLLPGRYYFVFAYVTGPEGGLNGTLSPAVEIFVPTASNSFAQMPLLLATPTTTEVQLSFSATQEFGLAWVMLVDAWLAYNVSIANVKTFQNAVGGTSCRKEAISISTSIQEVLLAESAPNARDGCDLISDGMYVAVVYIEDTNGLDDGSLEKLLVHVIPELPASNATTVTTDASSNKTVTSLGHIRVTWLQKETDAGGPVDRYRVFLNGTEVYDDFGIRSSLEQSRAGSPPQWVRMVDLACTPGTSFQITLSGRNYGGWSALSDPLDTGCFLTPGSTSNLHEVPGSRGTASLSLAWTAPVDVAGAETAFYNVYRDQGLRQALFQLIGTSVVPSFHDTGLDAGRAYGYQVAAVNAFGEGPVSDVLFVQAVPTPTTSATELMGILNQASIQLSPPATHGVLDELDGVVQIYSDVARDLRVESYASQRLAHLAIFGPIILTLEVIDLVGSTGENDPCQEARFALDVRGSHEEFCAGDAGGGMAWTLQYGEFAIVSWKTGWLSASTTSLNGWYLSLKPIVS